MRVYKNLFFIFLFLFILTFPTTVFAQTTQNNIPDWVRTTAYWWSQGEISDSEYKNAMKFLIKLNMIIPSKAKRRITCNIMFSAKE